MLNITDIRIKKVVGSGKMKAVASITIDDAFVIHDIKVVDGHNGLFVAMPSKKLPDGDFRDVAHPISVEARAFLQEKIFSAYEGLDEAQE
ncbi:MAG: septation regulator SpoVG [Tissierellia bacterium]|nr:septation regulator SpoVG [Tissierellia bacterium]